MRRAAAIALLGWVALWPLAHRGLVARYDLNPWKLGAWAMYTTPIPPVLAVVAVERPAGLVALDEEALPGETRAVLQRFRAERHALGRLRTPEDVAAAVFAAQPDLQFLAVLVQWTRLDRATARMRTERERFVFDRLDFSD